MGYIIEPLPLITFLDESKLKLPRFQRKATWDKKQNFELAISIFQDYPVGVVIINKEQRVSWLLDGRQRRNALITMRDNPVQLYEWARNYIGFNKNADDLELATAYWGKVERYLQTEERSDLDVDEYESDDESENDISSDENSFNSTKQRKGLQTLLDIILMVHQNKSNGSKWEKLFDFKDYVKRLRYTPLKNAGQVSPVLLRRFILEMIKDFKLDDDGELSQSDFIDYFEQNFDVIDKQKFKKEIEKRWDNIERSIRVIMHSEKIFSDARIGIIRLTNATALDAQNIFSRINKGGTQLKAEELLSAKPYWNREVAVLDQMVRNLVRNMYTKLEIPTPESIVRWDLAATLISRIKDEHLIFDSYDEAKKKNEVSMDEISMGFKLLSAVYQGGMSGRHVIDLEKNETIKWDTDIEELIDSLNIICNILLQDSFFKYLQSWCIPITRLLGNAIALEFITILWQDWKDKGMPKFSESGEMKALRRDARGLFDRLVFEYATKTWRGSGDSKMANDIKNWKSRIASVSDEDWRVFIAGACTGSYNGQPTTVKLLRPILYYYYVIREQRPINQSNVSFDVDHIIPKEIFEGNGMINQLFRDSLVNLALLPTKENISKKSKKLNEIQDRWLKSQIMVYAGIEENDFEKYSDVTNLDSLKEKRKRLFEIAFSINRKTMLAN